MNMWEGSYGKEPFDLRLTVLRMLVQGKWILLVTLAGTLIFGGIYYGKNVLGAETEYCAASTFHVDYAVEEEKDVGVVYINETTWNTYLTTDFFLEGMMEKTGLTREELTGALQAKLASDLRVPSIEATCESPELCIQIAHAAEEVILEKFPGEIKEIEAVQVLDSPKEATLVKRDVRPARAFLLSGILSCFGCIIFLLLKELGEDAVWLPATIERRYGKKAAGTLESRKLEENLQYFYEGKENIAVCTVQDTLDSAEICKELPAGKNWIPAPAVFLCPEGCRELRKADGILLAVRAGKHAGKQLEAALEFLAEQDCNVTAVVLCEADEWLLNCYYGRKYK